MSVTVRISDKMKKHPTRDYPHAVDPSLANRYWYKAAINQYAKDVGHPDFNPKTMESRKYYDRFWAEIIREQVATQQAPQAQPTPVVTQPTHFQSDPVTVQTKYGTGRVFAVKIKGQVYSFTSYLTDEQAKVVCRRITEPRDIQFVTELLSKPTHSPNQMAWIHKLGMDQCKREGDPNAVNNPAPPPPPPTYPSGPMKSRYKPQRRSKSYWPNGAPEPVQQPLPLQGNLSASVVEMANPEFPADGDSAFASDIGITAQVVGTTGWPKTIEYNGMSYTMYAEEKDKGGDLTAMLYHSDNAFFLRVFNT